MHKKLSMNLLAIFCSLFLLIANSVQAASEPVDQGIYTIQNIEANIQGDTLYLLLKGDSAPAYTVYELFSPTRLVLDIANAKLDGSIDTTQVIPTNDFAGLKISTLQDEPPAITRFEITRAESHTYKIDRIGNDLSIRLFPEDATDATATAETSTPLVSPSTPILHNILVQKTGTQTEILLQAGQPISDYRQDSVSGHDGLPDSMYIDINNIDGSELVRQTMVGSASLDKIRMATRGTGVRIVFDSAMGKLFPYNIKTVPQGLMVTIDENKQQKPTGSSIASTHKNTENNVVADPTLDALIDSSEAVLSDTTNYNGDDLTAAEAMQDSFEFSGYKAARISVDFYKIDLHNVFRLFRQISDINLIVDESVSGSLTLALNDVPWDFALDIILNLKNLKKEERHNTIVIYPAKKKFEWPDKATDNLTFEADVEVIEQEALIIQQSTNQSAEITQAKELLRRAKIEENNDDIEDAATLYQKAFKLWPDNANISNKLAALYLVKLRMNVQAAHFAKETLKIDKKNYQAALYAAIASANMDQAAEAMDYFSQSINGEPPMKEALISYAAFSENKGQPEAALKLLNRYSDVYSDTVDTMISRGRLLDALGRNEQAIEQYKTLLYSGFQLTPGLKKYIRSRLSMKSN